MHLRGRNKGSILVLVLSILAFLGFIVISFSTRMSYESKMVFSTKDKMQALFISCGAVEYLKKLLKQDDPTVDSINDNWFISPHSPPRETKLKEGKWKIEVGYDEESRVNLNMAVTDKSGFKIVERIFRNYPQYFLCLLDWLDGDDVVTTFPNNPKYQGYQGAERNDPYYVKQGYLPRNGYMKSLMELRMIKGASRIYPLKKTKLSPSQGDFFIKKAYASHANENDPEDPPPEDIIPPVVPPPPIPDIPVREPSPDPGKGTGKGGGTGLTVYGDGKININTAWSPVLRAAGFSVKTTRRLLAYRLKKNVFKQATAAHIIGRLIAEDLLRKREAAFDEITQNIRDVFATDRIKVNSKYFRFLITSFTEHGAAHKTMVVLKREGSQVKVVTWWEEFL